MLDRDVEPFAVEAVTERPDVVEVRRLKYAMNHDGVEVVFGKGAVVEDINDARAFLGNQRGEAGQTAGTVTDGCGEPA